jgi:uncharacterized phage infection (PIP) family protein YhgE
MIYNLYEIADIYKVSRQYVQRKYREYKNKLQATQRQPRGNQKETRRQPAGNPEATCRQPKELKKDNRTALKNKDLIDFLNYMGYDSAKLTGNPEATRRQPAGNQKATQRQPRGNPEATKNKDELIKFLQAQLEKKDDQLESKDNIINQQNQILMATQKNMNDLIQKHSQLEMKTAKKQELIKQLKYDKKKTESSIRAISKLERTIDDALLEKRLRDGIEFSKKLLKEKKGGEI